MANETRTADAPWLRSPGLLLAACGSDRQSSEPPPVRDTVAGDMVNAMEEARAVEGVLQQHQEAFDRTLQQNENASVE
jgi:hypothetical protein